MGMNAAEIRQMLRDAIDQFPERDEMLADLGLQKRHSHVPMWIASVTLLGVGLGVGAYGSRLVRHAFAARSRRRSLLATIGSAVIGAGAGAGVLALASERGRRTDGAGDYPVDRETRVAEAP
jgi:hypothetical protein